MARSLKKTFEFFVLSKIYTYIKDTLYYNSLPSLTAQREFLNLSILLHIYTYFCILFHYPLLFTTVYFRLFWMLFLCYLTHYKFEINQYSIKNVIFIHFEISVFILEQNIHNPFTIIDFNMYRRIESWPNSKTNSSNI